MRCSILGRDLQIIHQSSVVDDAGTVADGLYVPDRQVILLHSGCGPDKMRATLVHEILHAMIDILGLNEEKEFKEESLVSGLTAAWYHFLREPGNRDVLAFITAGMK